MHAKKRKEIKDREGSIKYEKHKEREEIQEKEENQYMEENKDKDNFFA